MIAETAPGTAAEAVVETVAAEVEPDVEAAQADVEAAQAEAEAEGEVQERLDSERAQAILDGALDALGSAHHRPFSRG
jgi:hypothetical protein